MTNPHRHRSAIDRHISRLALVHTVAGCIAGTAAAVVFLLCFFS